MDNIQKFRLDEGGKEFWNLIESSIDMKLDGMASRTSSIEGSPLNFHARFTSKNSKLQGTRYFYSESKKILHFTSLKTLFSIINEGSLRLYNLHNSDDETEYLYASKKLETIYKLQGFDKEKIIIMEDFHKENSFTLSCTCKEKLDNLDFWKEYGGKGEGVAIEFEIINDIINWENFYLSKVIYNELNSLDNLIQNWTEIQKKYSTNSYTIDCDQILSLHKSRDYCDEDEIRLLCLLPQLEVKSLRERVYRDFKLSKWDKSIKYLKLPLCDKDGEFIDSNFRDSIQNIEKEITIPKIKIVDIHFGPDCPIDDKFQSNLGNCIWRKMRCNILNRPKPKIKIKS